MGTSILEKGARRQCRAVLLVHHHPPAKTAWLDTNPSPTSGRAVTLTVTMKDCSVQKTLCLSVFLARCWTMTNLLNSDHRDVATRIPRLLPDLPESTKQRSNAQSSRIAPRCAANLALVSASSVTNAGSLTRQR